MSFNFSGGGLVNGALNGALLGSKYGPHGGAIGGLMGGLLGGLSSNKSNSARKALQAQEESTMRLLKYQQDYNNWYTENQASMIMAGNKKAGIHPFYGLGNGHTPTSASASLPDYVGEQNAKINERKTLTDAIQNGIQIAQDWSAKRAQIKLMENQANTEQYNTFLKRAEVVGQELKNLESKTNLTYQEKLLKTQLQKEYADINRTIAETTRINLENEKNEVTNRYYRNHPLLAELGEGATQLKDLTGLPAKYIETIFSFKKRGKKNKNVHKSEKINK